MEIVYGYSNAIHRIDPPHGLTAPPKMSSSSKLRPRIPFDPSTLKMTTLIPREPYSPEELNRLYPKELQLQLVQVVSGPNPNPSMK